MDSDNRNEEKRARSQMGRLTFQRNRVSGHNLLMVDYFVPGATFPGYLFCRCFRMSEQLFHRIVDDMEANVPVQATDECCLSVFFNF